MSFQEQPSMCPVCSRGKEFAFLQDCSNAAGVFSLYQCAWCFVQFWMPLKAPGAQWYEKGDAYQISELVPPKVSRGYHKAFLRAYAPSIQGKSVLDVGCGTGEFLSALRDMGADVWGMDFARTAIATAKANFHLDNVYAMPLEQFFKDIQTPEFDIITCFEVIEHVDDPLSLLESLRKHLKPGGRIVLTAPSRERFGADLNRWDFPPNHLTRWNEEAMRRLSSLTHLEVMNAYSLETFRILLEAVNARFHFRLAGKAVRLAKQNKLPSIAPRSVVALGILKDYLLGFLPAAFLWVWGIMTKRKNGILVFELQKRA